MADNKNFYALYLDDYALPGFASGQKIYYGTLEDMEHFFCILSSSSRSSDSYQETIHAFQEFKNGNMSAEHTVAYSKHRLLEPVESVIALVQTETDEVTWLHKNIYHYSYFMKADGVQKQHVWLIHNSKFLRCVKASFKNLCCASNVTAKKVYTPIGDTIWGFPGIITEEKTSDGNTTISNTLYVVETAFHSKTEFMGDQQSFDGIGNYTEFCNDIFADG